MSEASRPSMQIPIPFTDQAITVRIEPHARRPLRLGFRPRLSVRGMMVGIAILALGLGGVLAWRRDEERRAFLHHEAVERSLTIEAGVAERQGRAVEAAKARFFAAEAGRAKARYRP